MLRALIALVLLALAGNAFSQTVLTCTPPTKNTDGSNITGTITYKFYEGTTAGSFNASSPPQNACSYTWPGLSPGQHFFVVSATTAAGESMFSNVATNTIAPPKPNPPTNLTATSPTAYEMRKDASGKAVAYAVGTVQLGSLCGTEERVVAGVSYRRVEHADLVVWPQKLPLEAWARCGAG